MSFLYKRIKLDPYLIGLIVILCVCYLIGMKITGAFNSINSFNSILVTDTAQIARNTLRGDFFVTKYIFPVGYMYFPHVIKHPDFIRYPFQILLYTFLFWIFSPSAMIVKFLNSVLFVINGVLIYRFALKIQKREIKETEKRKIILQKIIAIFVAITSSLFVTSYFQMALSDSYEVISYTLILIAINVVIDNRHPLLVGIVCGLLYLSKPNLSLLVFTLVIYYLIPKIPTKKWFISGIYCALGIIIVVSPFIVRSYVLTGQIMFMLQQKVDIIKGVVSSHDELYKSFSFPPAALTIIYHNKIIYLLRWQERVFSAFTTLLRTDNLVSWIGLPFFLAHFTRSKSLVYSYLVFLIAHIVIVANYLAVDDTARVYTSILPFLVVLGTLGLFKAGFTLLTKLPQIRIQNVVIVFVLVSLLSLSIFIDFHGGLKPISPRVSIPKEVINKIHDINPPCLYSNSPYQAAWDLDIPTIYKPVENRWMLTDGPKECRYFLYVLDDNFQTIMDFLSKNGKLLFNYGNYRFYELLK